MIVADTSALISLSIADCLDLTLTEFEMHTTSTVIEELEETAKIDDVHGRGAAKVLDRGDDLTVHEIDDAAIPSSRIDRGEASCLALERAVGANYLLTDDLRALPELQVLSDAEVAISPLLLRALVTRGVLKRTQARDHLDDLAASRDWLGAPIYRKARELFEDFE